MPRQGHHCPSFLSLLYIITFNSPKNHLPMICYFYSDFWWKLLFTLSTPPLPAKILFYLLLCSKSSWKIHLYLHFLFPQLSFFQVYFHLVFILPYLQKMTKTRSSITSVLPDAQCFLSFLFGSNLIQKFNNKNSANHTRKPLLIFKLLRIYITFWHSLSLSLSVSVSPSLSFYLLTLKQTHIPHFFSEIVEDKFYIYIIDSPLTLNISLHIPWE